MYKDETFQVRSVEEIQGDIDAIARLVRDLKGLPPEKDSGDPVSSAGAAKRLLRNPQLRHHPGFSMVLSWMLSGGKNAFLQDANSLIMKTESLVQALQHLRRTFPSIRRVTSYVRAKTLVQKSQEELLAIRRAGLDRLHVGLESGDDEVLKSVRKGVTGEQHVRAGRKALRAGFQLSEYWMPGLGGKKRTVQHADLTAAVLNRIQPHYIRSRPLHPWPGTPLADLVGSGKQVLLSPAETLLEIRRMVAALEVTSRVCFDHAGNYWKDRQGRHLFSLSYEGYAFPDQKQELLKRIDEGLPLR
jgi:hypothetical protein